ncbi:DUF2125 domain-containing protein [Mesorhizobium sp. DCY119]|uniref:DUF2125 domain-containing protein n=1 Tax=Mesorhizobium sp. DCY119 TaxID=2108445 RepID=UPI000E6BF2F4|nr:DUF2125 domain-containing protein [Mesorhizobium sp. DCY119]RJG43846.1 DUF2125 domain-containing protein [Mesorhizobium sp. DCY119]
MTATELSKPNYNRRILWLAAFVVLLFGGYSVGWFYLAGKVETKAKAEIASLNRDGMVAECTNPVARGYPFRLGLFCDHVAFEDAGRGVSVSAGNFRSAGQIYDPTHLIAEIDGPARIDVPQSQPLALTWDNLRASVRLAQPLPERVSVEGKMLKAATDAGAPLLAADTFEGHVRPNGQDLDLAGSFAGLALDSSLVEGRTLPLLSGDTDLTVKNGVTLIAQKAQSLRGQSGTIRSLDLSTSETAGLSLSGPFSVGEDGLLDAQFKLTVRDPQGLAMALSEAIPEKSEQIQQGFAALSMLGSAPSLPLKISKGRASFGFIKLGNVPPLK